MKRELLIIIQKVFIYLFRLTCFGLVLRIIRRQRSKGIKRRWHELCDLNHDGEYDYMDTEKFLKQNHKKSNERRDADENL